MDFLKNNATANQHFYRSPYLKILETPNIVSCMCIMQTSKAEFINKPITKLLRLYKCRLGTAKVICRVMIQKQNKTNCVYFRQLIWLTTWVYSRFYCFNYKNPSCLESRLVSNQCYVIDLLTFFPSFIVLIATIGFFTEQFSIQLLGLHRCVLFNFKEWLLSCLLLIDATRVWFQCFILQSWNQRLTYAF